MHSIVPARNASNGVIGVCMSWSGKFQSSKEPAATTPYRMPFLYGTVKRSRRSALLTSPSTNCPATPPLSCLGTGPLRFVLLKAILFQILGTIGWFILGYGNIKHVHQLAPGRLVSEYPILGHFSKPSMWNLRELLSHLVTNGTTQYKFNNIN